MITRAAAFVALVLVQGVCLAQLSAERLYYGIGQRVPVTIETPEDYFGEITLAIYEPARDVWAREAPAASGRVDLASIFPDLWTNAREGVRYVQLSLDGEPTGAPLVLQPLLTPERATLRDATTGAVSEDPQADVVFEGARLRELNARGLAPSPDREVTFSGLRVYTDKEVVIDTTLGEIVVRLRPDAAPNTAFNFLHLVEGGFFTNVIFHRVVAALPDGRPFVIQAGDLSGSGSGGPGYMIDLENSTLPHDVGVLSMARDADPDTNGSQFFIALSREGTDFLDRRYTSFAETVEGLDTIRAIASVRVNADDRPINAPIIRSCVSRDAPPIQRRRRPVSESNPTIDAAPER